MQINLDDVKIEPSWKEVLKDEFLSENFARIKENFLKAKSAGVVYPPSGLRPRPISRRKSSHGTKLFSAKWCASAAKPCKYL